MREVLVIEELREAELQLGDPEVERVLAIRQRVGRLLDEENVLGIVVHVRDLIRDLGKKCDRVHQHRQRDDQDEGDPAETREV